MPTAKGGIQKRVTDMKGESIIDQSLGHHRGLALVVLNNHVHSHHQREIFNISTLACNQDDPTECDSWHEVRPEW